MKTYKKLDIKALQQKSTKTATTKEALKDIRPFPYSKEVLNGERKIIIDTRGNSNHV